MMSYRYSGKIKEIWRQWQAAKWNAPLLWIKITMWKCYQAHGKSLSTVVISNMSCRSYAALQRCERTSVQCKGEDYIRGLNKGTCQQHRLVWTMTCPCNHFSYWRNVRVPRLIVFQQSLQNCKKHLPKHTTPGQQRIPNPRQGCGCCCNFPSRVDKCHINPSIHTATTFNHLSLLLSFIN